MFHREQPLKVSIVIQQVFEQRLNKEIMQAQSIEELESIVQKLKKIITNVNQKIEQGMYQLDVADIIVFVEKLFSDEVALRQDALGQKFLTKQFKDFVVYCVGTNIRDIYDKNFIADRATYYNIPLVEANQIISELTAQEISQEEEAFEVVDDHEKIYIEILNYIFDNDEFYGMNEHIHSKLDSIISSDTIDIMIKQALFTKQVWMANGLFIEDNFDIYQQLYEEILNDILLTNDISIDYIEYYLQTKMKSFNLPEEEVEELLKQALLTKIMFDGKKNFGNELLYDKILEYALEECQFTFAEASQYMDNNWQKKGKFDQEIMEELLLTQLLLDNEYMLENSTDIEEFVTSELISFKVKDIDKIEYSKKVLLKRWLEDAILTVSTEEIKYKTEEKAYYDLGLDLEKASLILTEYQMKYDSLQQSLRNEIHQEKPLQELIDKYLDCSEKWIVDIYLREANDYILTKANEQQNRKQIRQFLINNAIDNSGKVDMEELKTFVCNEDLSIKTVNEEITKYNHRIEKLCILSDEGYSVDEIKEEYNYTNKEIALVLGSKYKRDVNQLKESLLTKQLEQIDDPILMTGVVEVLSNHPFKMAEEYVATLRRDYWNNKIVKFRSKLQKYEGQDTGASEQFESLEGEIKKVQYLRTMNPELRYLLNEKLNCLKEQYDNLKVRKHFRLIKSSPYKKTIKLNKKIQKYQEKIERSQEKTLSNTQNLLEKHNNIEEELYEDEQYSQENYDSTLSENENIIPVNGFQILSQMATQDPNFADLMLKTAATYQSAQQDPAALEQYISLMNQFYTSFQANPEESSKHKKGK